MSWQHPDEDYEKGIEKKIKPGSKRAAPSAAFGFFGFLIFLGIVLYFQRSCGVMYEW